MNYKLYYTVVYVVFYKLQHIKSKKYKWYYNVFKNHTQQFTVRITIILMWPYNLLHSTLENNSRGIDSKYVYWE